MPGGFVNRVVRVGNTVRREPGERAEFVRRLLHHFEEQGWDGAPRFLGTDAQGRDVFTYLAGHVAYRPTGPEVSEPDTLVRVARLVRRFHDLTAGTPLAGGQEVVCHNDLSPKNTVYDLGGHTARPIAFIDWDLAAPGVRIHDVAHMCWQYLYLGPDVRDVGETATRMRLLCDAYGLDDRSAVIDTILWWQDRCRHGIEERAAAGSPAMVALRDAGVPCAIRASSTWIRAHRPLLQSHLT